MKFIKDYSNNEGYSSNNRGIMEGIGFIPATGTNSPKEITEPQA